MAVQKRSRQRPPPEPSAVAPEAPVRPGATVAELAREWLKRRDKRSRAADTQRLRDHVLPLLGNRRLRDLRPEDVVGVVRHTLGKKGMSVKSAKNAYGTFSELLADALARGLLRDDPRQLPPDVWPVEPASAPRFDPDEVEALTHDERLDLDQRLHNLLAFHSGLDTRAVCELRFGTWSERVRAPLAPQLAVALERWQRGGFESVYGRPPVAGDWLVPRRSDPTQPHTEGSAYKAFRRACVALKLPLRSPRAIQNTFASEAAGGPRQTPSS